LQHLGLCDLILLDHTTGRFSLVESLIKASLLLLVELLLQPGDELNFLGSLLLCLVLFASLGITQLLIVELFLLVDLALELSLLFKLLLLLLPHSLQQLAVIVALLFLLHLFLASLLLELKLKHVS
jgi:hypothetical protein